MTLTVPTLPPWFMLPLALLLREAIITILHQSLSLPPSLSLLALSFVPPLSEREINKVYIVLSQALAGVTNAALVRQGEEEVQCRGNCCCIRCCYTLFLHSTTFSVVQCGYQEEQRAHQWLCLTADPDFQIWSWQSLSDAGIPPGSPVSPNYKIQGRCGGEDRHLSAVIVTWARYQKTKISPDSQDSTAS